jgi:hypothetical protein
VDPRDDTEPESELSLEISIGETEDLGRPVNNPDFLRIF